MSKVDELAKCVAEILEPTLNRLYRWNLPEGKYEEIAIKASLDMLKTNLAKQILSHPDLALIDREIPWTGPEQDTKLAFVIPLADALKEEQDETIH